MPVVMHRGGASCGRVGAIGCLGVSLSLLAQAVCMLSSSWDGLCGHVGTVGHVDALSASLSLCRGCMAKSEI